MMQWDFEQARRACDRTVARPRPAAQAIRGYDHREGVERREKWTDERAVYTQQDACDEGDRFEGSADASELVQINHMQDRCMSINCGSRVGAVCPQHHDYSLMARTQDTANAYVCNNWYVSVSDEEEDGQSTTSCTFFPTQEQWPQVQ
jgi:hypothetical protein